MKPSPNMLTDIPARTLEPGDRLMTDKYKHVIVKTVVFPAKGCGNVHVITSAQSMIQCYDRVSTVTVLS